MLLKMLARNCDQRLGHLLSGGGPRPRRRRQGPRSSNGANIARLGVAAAAAVAILASPLEMGVSAASRVRPQGEPPPSARASAGAAIRDASCTSPTTTTSKRAATTRAFTTGAALLGDGADPLGILGALADGAESFGESDGLGWLLGLVSGQQTGVDAATIQAQVDAIDSQLGSLSQQQYNDCEAMLQAITQAANNADKGFYDDEATIIDGYVGTIETYQQDFDAIVSALQANGGDVTALSSTYKQDLEDMLSGTPTGLRGLIDQVNTVEGAAQGQSDNMVQQYSKILTEELGYDPYQSHLFPAAFVDAGYAQIDYYAEALDQAAVLYANVAHLNFTDGSSTYTSDPASIINLVNLAQADIHAWSVAFSDGPPGDGTANWVSQTTNQAIGAPIPADTVLDYRMQGHPMLWTDTPVALNGDPTNPAPFYCASTAQFCYADFFDARSIVPFYPGRIASSSLALPSPEPLPTIIAADTHDGLSGWRVPTTTDWQDLEAGATGGLTAWGPAHQLDMFAPQTVTSHLGGKDLSEPVVAPVLVDTGSSAGPYGVLTGYSGLNTLVLEQPSFGGSTQNDIAGRLFLALDYQPTATPAPFSLSSLGASRPGHAKKPVATKPPADKPAKLATGRDNQAPMPVPGPTTFSTPSACSSANSYTVPDGVAAVRITAVGAAGAPGTLNGTPTAAGGVGGLVTETFPVTPGGTLYVQVGGAGHGVTGGVGGGGNAGAAGPDQYNDMSGGGGGASGVSSTPDCSQWLVVAGGGGGGGSGVYSPADAIGDSALSLIGGQGGNGCAATGTSCQGATAGANNPEGPAGTGGQPGQPAPDNQGGAAGQPHYSSATGGNGSAGGSMNGGAGGVYQAEFQQSYLGGGGGGGGYYGGGGGGGAGYLAAGGGGAGGASFAIPGGSNIGFYTGAAGQNGSVTITPLATAPAPISVSAANANVNWGLPVTLTATLPADATGSVGFYDSSNPGPDKGIGAAPIEDGQATLRNVTVPLAVGTHDIYAYYGGDTHYLPNGSAQVTVTVSKATPPITLTVNGSVFPVGKAPSSLVVQLPADATGSVGFYDDVKGGCEGSTASGAACQGLGVAPILDGYATLTTLSVPLGVGPHYLHASYGGDGNYLGNQSNVVTVSVRRVSSTDS